MSDWNQYAAHTPGKDTILLGQEPGTSEAAGGSFDAELLFAKVFAALTTELTLDDTANDFVLSYDNSANTLKRIKLDNLPGGGGGLSAVNKTNADTPYTSATGEWVQWNTSAGACVQKLPATPSEGDRVGASLQVGGNNLTIDRNGSTIDGAASDQILTLVRDYIAFEYDGATWIITDDLVRPHMGEMVLTNGQTVNDGSTDKVDFATSVRATGLTVDTTGKKITVARDGLYEVWGPFLPGADAGSTGLRVLVYVNGDQALYQGGLLDLSSGDEVEIYVDNQTGGNVGI